VCTHDALCPNGQVCRAIPHYAKVRQLERDCRRPVGGGAGLAACAADADCQSGLCVVTMMGTPRFCFEACTETMQCGANQTCGDGVGAVSLDATLAGLGTAATSGCISN